MRIESDRTYLTNTSLGENGIIMIEQYFVYEINWYEMLTNVIHEL